MTKKEQIIKQISNFDNRYFNEDQKNIAKKIIENADENEVQVFADFIFMKRRTGFAFDYSPEIAKGRIITLKEDVEKRVNVGDAVSEWENKLIIGDNFNAIKSLLVTHKGKFDAIYIDPPYNTEKTKEDGNQSAKEGESAKFIYKDKFGRTGWLTFLKDRLSLAKELLKQQGVIFISIDDSEQAYLKVLMDDIFGEENFISNVYWRSRSSQNYSDKHISNVGEYVIIYAKDKSSLAEFNKDKSNPTDYKNLDNDPRGPWTSSGIIRDDGRKKYTVVSPSGKKWPKLDCTLKKTLKISMTREEFGEEKMVMEFQEKNHI